MSLPQMPQVFPAASTPRFVAPKNRDAWSTIRGFVYQADLTIERWLRLDDRQELQLECGEDIDTVTRYIEGGDEQRLLEQVKYREEEVTLKSRPSLAVLANAVEHRRANPTLLLLFRYTTNASVGRERLSPFPSGAKGIEVWERLRALVDSSLQVTDAATLVSGLRQLFTGITRPDDHVSQDIWNRFKAFWASSTEDELRNFIRTFEWSTGTTTAVEMSDVIQRLLLEEGHAPDAVAAYNQYQKLFLMVLKTLSERTGKRLTRAGLLAAIKIPLGVEERNFFETFLSEMSLLNTKMVFVQAQLVRQEQSLGNVATQVGQLLNMGCIQALTLNAPIPIFEPPPPEEHLSPRTLTIDSLRQDLGEFTWLVLTGGSGIGKSHLILLLAATLPGCPVWLRLRDMDVERAAANLDSAFLHLNEGKALPNRQAWYTAVCRRYGAGQLFVLDDLPAMTAGDALAQRLDVLARACAEVGVKLATTSVQRLPGPLLRAARGIAIHKDAPLLTDIEASEMLRALGAPSLLLDDQARVRFLNNVARRHPTLLGAMAFYLRERGWESWNEQFDALLRGRFAEDVNDETVRRLLLTVTDDRSRELLYRLNLVLGTFDMEVVRLLAAVEPLIPAPREKLIKLAGLWVQRDTGERLRVSPLIGALGSDDLDESVRRACRHALGRYECRTGNLGPIEIQNAVTYLASAGQHDEAILLLSLILSQLYSALSSKNVTANHVKKTGILGLYNGVPLPESVSLNNRILLRSYQIPLRNIIAEDTSFAARDLSRLIASAGQTEGSALVAATVLAVPTLAMSDFEASCRIIEKTITVLPDAVIFDGSAFQLPGGMMPGTLMWLNLEGVRTKAHVLRWCQMLREVSAEIRAQALADSQFSNQAASLLMDRFWLTEAEKPEEAQEWERLLQDMGEIADAAGDVGAFLLVATAARAKVLVLCEKMGAPDWAIAVAEEALDHLPDDPRVIFMVADAVGRKLSYLDGREGEAQVWLERAVAACERVPHALRWERAMALLALGRLADKCGDANQAAEVIGRAVALVRTSAFCPEIELVKFLGDFSLALWKQGDREGAFDALDDGGSRLLRLKNDTPEWKALFTLFGHTAGYMLSMATIGQPPTMKGDGEPYVFPPIGNFHDKKEERLAAFYEEEREPLLLSVMSNFAEAMGRDDRVADWAARALQAARSSPHMALLVSTVFFDLLPHLVNSGRYAEVFDGCREAALAAVAGAVELRSGRDTLLHEIDVYGILGEPGSDQRDEAEAYALATTLVPLALRLGLLKIRARTDERVAERLMRDVRLVTNLCMETAAVSTRPMAWNEAASLIEDCYLAEPSMEAVIARANGYSEADAGLKALGYLGAMLGRVVSLSEACRGQMNVLPFCLRSLVSEGGYRLLLLPLIVEFWNVAIRYRRILFTPPALVEESFRSALSLPERERVRRVMEVVAVGTGISHDPVVQRGFRNWDEVVAQVLKRVPE